MQNRKTYAVNIFMATTLLMGCSSHKTAPISATQKNTAPTQIKTPKKTGISLSQLRKSNISSNVSLKAKHSYALNESIQFVIDTGSAEGYIYIIYLDNKGETGILYPNANAPLSEMSGSFIFPQDFGNMNIRATKDCKSCSEEKTVIYAIVSKEPIVDINKITKNDLLSFTSSSSKSRGLSLELNSNSKNSSNLHVGSVNFFVR